MYLRYTYKDIEMNSIVCERCTEIKHAEVVVHTMTLCTWQAGRQAGGGCLYGLEPSLVDTQASESHTETLSHEKTKQTKNNHSLSQTLPHPNIHRGRGIHKAAWGEIDRTNNEIQHICIT